VALLQDRRLARLNLAHKIKLEYQGKLGRGPAEPTLRDVSMGGAFVEIKSLRLSDLNIKLILPENSKNVVYLHRITARVIRINEEGVALKFRAFDNRFYLYLLRMMSLERQRA